MNENIKRVLIATTNNDKFNAVRKIFENTIFPKEKYKIESLKTIDVKLEDQEEIGNHIERAKQKALYAKKQLEQYGFDYIVGLDDAIIIKGRLEPNIKQYLNKILYENYLSENEEYSFTRAYCIISKDNTIYSTTADIPYIYKSNKNIVIEEYSYPLSQVAYPLGYDKPINELTEQEELEYYLKYVKRKLISLNIK